MQYYRITKKTNKKGMGLADFFSVLTFALILIVFYLLLKFTIGKIPFEIAKESSNIDGSLSLLGILRTPVVVDGSESDIAELIRLWSLEPDKYKELLENTAVNLLDKLEYKYIDQETRNTRIRGFYIAVNKEDIGNNAISPLIEFNSKNFESGNCISDQNGCINLGEQYIPISETSNVYVILRESNKAK